MGKVEDALRDLISYHAKRATAEALKDVPAQIRESRRQLRQLQKAVEQLAVQLQKVSHARVREAAVPPAAEEEVESVRFDKRTLKGVRQRFDLTQQELAKLLEVSPVTVTSWETGKSRPRRQNLAQIVTLRNMEKAAVDEALGREKIPAALSPEQIKRVRVRLRLTQAQLAKLLRVSSAAVASWEAAKTKPSRVNRAVLDHLTQADPADVAERLGLPRSAGGGSVGLSPADVRAIRARAELSQRGMATALGVSLNTISNWETGRSAPRPKSLQRLLTMRAGK